MTVAHIGWDPLAPGVLTLPSGRTVRGRGLHAGVPTGPEPTWGLYLLGRRPREVGWESRWLRWPDFRLPADRVDAKHALEEAWSRLDDQRVEIACAGGIGRTGTALAVLVLLDRRNDPAHPAAEDPIAFVRAGYHPRAVETPWQRRYVRSFA